ncbi:hypothetical protein MKX01_001527 [Papaver californicum]|nr:hypothetical protein MKX01_001527 [Papaver californicum]
MNFGDEENVDFADYVKTYKVGTDNEKQSRSDKEDDKDKDGIYSNSDWYRDWESRYAHYTNDEDAELFDEGKEVVPVDHKKMEVKTIFSNKKEFQKHLRGYYVANECQSKFTKSCTHKCRAACKFYKKYDCKWFVSATKVKGCNNFKVRKVNLTHTKYYGDYLNRNRSVDPHFVKGVVLDKLRETFGSVIPKPRQIKDDFLKSHNTNIPYIFGWMARNLVLEELFGNYEDNYKLVPDLCKMVTKTNEGFVVVWSFRKTDHIFESMTISFVAPMKVFQDGCRAVVGLDTCHLTSKFGGVLMAATTLDGQNGLMPLGICVCRSETKENWASFLIHLKPGLKGHKISVCFISDKPKGLLEVVPIVFPGHQHRYC